MGLFSALRGALKAVPLIGDALSANDSKKATRNADAAIQAAITQGRGALDQQFGETEANLTPWITSGQNAVSARDRLLGLGGADGQAAEIEALRASPLFQSLFRNGLDTVLGAASATGGLRGGNANRSLYNLGEDTLAKVIERQLAGYGDVATQGLGAAGTLGEFGSANANSIVDLILGSGRSKAGSILGQDAIDSQLYSGLRNSVRSAAGGAAGVPGGAGGTPDIGSIISKIFGEGYGKSGGLGGMNPDFSTSNAWLSGKASGWAGTALPQRPLSLAF